ncbi:Aldehyde/histidinol dehydrogenase [Halenospora varia]|nr:Aldehyde/histidinol dehydrogenase [Halenospora varia]
MTSPIVKLTGVAGRQLEVPTGLFINNEFVPAKNGSTLETLNPSTGEVLATISAAEQEDVDIAVASAKKAYEEVWSKFPGQQRRVLLLKLADLIERDAEDFATLEALDGGILYNDSKNMNVPYTVECLRYFAGWADKIDGKSMRIPLGMAYTKREPIGVCAAIVPWNSPLMITAWKVAPCLAVGNVLVLKTAELTPLYGLKLATLIKETGFPPGVVNILTGFGKTAGQALAEHMDVDKLAFTGSGAVGRGIMIAAAKSNLKKITLELGGKGATIIFDDADLDNAVFWATLGITVNNGQICVAGSRVYVQAGIYDKFIEAFRTNSTKVKVGDPLLGDTTKGPLVSTAQKDRVVAHIQKGLSEGATLLHGGENAGASGNFVNNTAFLGVTEDMSIMKEEIFGPVASIAKFSTEEEVIGLANNTVYGLSNAVFTDDISRAHRDVSTNVPFGGVKQSGFGRDMGEDALDGWTDLKSIKVNILPAQKPKL